jgi:hypothetical protein
MDEIEHKLKDAKKYSNKNKQVEQTYDYAVGAFSHAKAAVSHFVGTFDKSSS